MDYRSDTDVRLWWTGCQTPTIHHTANSSTWCLRHLPACYINKKYSKNMFCISLKFWSFFVTHFKLKLLHFYLVSGLMIKTELIIKHLWMSAGYVRPTLIMFSWIKLQLCWSQVRLTLPASQKKPSSLYNSEAFTFYSKILATNLFLYHKMQCSLQPVC